MSSAISIHNLEPGAVLRDLLRLRVHLRRRVLAPRILRRHGLPLAQLFFFALLTMPPADPEHTADSQDEEENNEPHERQADQCRQFVVHPTAAGRVQQVAGVGR